MSKEKCKITLVQKRFHREDRRVRFILSELVDGNSLADVKVVGELENQRVTIKDGKIYKNTL